MPQAAQDIDLLIKDLDGQFKVLDHGQLKNLPPQQTANVPTVTAPISDPLVKTQANFMLPAVVPKDEHFQPINKSNAGIMDSASFGFHPEDEQDLNLELERINTVLASTGQKKYSIEKITEKIVAKNGLNLSPEQYARLVKLLLSFFRQARSYSDVLSVLIEPLSSNGFALDQAKAQDILTIVRNLRDKIESVEGTVIEAQSVSAPQEVIQESKPEIKLPPIITQPIITPPVVPTPLPPMPEPNVQEVIIKPKKIVRTVEPKVNPSDLPKVKRPPTETAPVAAAPELTFKPEPLPKAKNAPKVMGKVDEIADLNMELFRQLDNDPRIAAAKILQRINTLGKDSLTRKAQGIEAWRNNQVYKLYLSLGAESLESSQKIEQVVVKRQTNQEPYLTVEEFEAISDLNKQLRF